jgi:hypothetical protein
MLNLYMGDQEVKDSEVYGSKANSTVYAKTALHAISVTKDALVPN